jgi:hypothetical protein
MAKKNRNTLKGFFETGKKPTEGQYANLIDSFAILNGENTGSLNIKGNTTLDGHLTASGGITASGDLVIGGEISASGGISSSGAITAQQFIGDGRLITNITSSQINITGITASFTSGAPTGSLIVSGNLSHPSSSTNILMAIKTTGSIIPAYTSNYDLGSPTNYWKSLFVSNSFATTYTGIFNGAVSGSTLSSATQGTTVLTTNGVAGSTIDLGLQTTDSVLFASITSSGNITASGAIQSIGGIEVGGSEGSGINFINDPDTFIYQDGSNEISFKAGNTHTLNILSSGIALIGNISTTGNSTLGNAISDTHTFNGHITASGNIRAVGTVFANNFQTIGTANESISFNDNLSITGSITASVDISASGNLIATNISASNDLTVVGTGSIAYLTTTNLIATAITASNLTATGNISASNLLLTSTNSPALTIRDTTNPEQTFIEQRDSILDIDLTGGDVGTANSFNIGTDYKANYFYIDASTGVTTIRGHLEMVQGGSGANSPAHITASGNISASGTGSFGSIDLLDNARISLGTSGDLLIYHEGNNSYIRDDGGGFLYIQASNSLILESATGENYFKGDVDGAVKLYYDNSEKLETTNVGVEITGGITASGDLTVSKKSILGGTVYISGSIYSGSGTNTQAALGEGEALVSLVLTGSVIPEGANKWSLGSPTNYFKEVYISEESVRFISASGEVTQLRQKDVKDLREGRPVKQDTAVEGTDVFLRAQAIFHETSNEHYIKQTIAGLWDYVGPGGNILTIDAREDVHSITMPGANSKLILTGEISASKTNASHVIGGTTRFGDGTVTINGPAGHITASSNISASGIVTGLTGSFNNLSTSVQVDGFVSAMGIGTPSNITSNVNIPANINAIQFTNNTGDLTIPAGIDYTINTGATISTPFLLDAVGGGAYMDGFLRINGNISSSGLIEATSASFGNLSILSFGNITSSGNISASGDLTATTGSFGRVETNDISASGLLYVNEIQDIATINHDNNAFGNLDFTSAGTLRLRSTNSTSYGLEFFGGAQSTAAPYIDTDSHTTFLLKVNGTERIAINSSGLTLTGNITSSANISASGTITANAFVGPITGTVTGTSTGLTGTPSILVANITSSGNISASGFISSSNIHNINNISTLNLSSSGDLRVDGTGSFSNLVVDGASGLTISSGAITGSIISGSIIIASQLTGSLSGNATGLSGVPSIAVNQITASATISSSGDITANNLTIANTSSLANVNINGTLSSSGTISAVSMSGDGSGITGVTAEWDGSRNGNSNITGSLTILGGITASVGISSSTIITTGGVTLGNAATDRHLITGNITSSGNLSSSGTITALTGSFGNLNISTFGNITSSGTISASGNITANSFTGIFVGAISSSTQIAAGISSSFVTNSATSSLILASQTSSFVLNSQSSSFVLNSQTSSLSNLTVTGSGNNSVSITTLGNITASAGVNASGTSSLGMLIVTQNITASNISASGNLIAGATTVGALTATTLNTGQGANELYDMDQNVLTTSNVKFGIVRTTNNLINSGSTALGNASADIHTIIGNVTSSGNISSSGTITAATLSVATFAPTNLTTGTITGSNVSASGFVSASNIHTIGNVTLLGNISGSGTTSLTIGGNTILNQITASGILSSGNISASGYISASAFSGDGSGLTGVTAEWDGTINGNAQITGSLILSGSGDTNLNVLGDITGSNISASGTVYAQDIVASNTITGIGFNNPNSISTNTTIPAGYNSVMFTTRYNPSITVPAGIEYTVSLGADVTLLMVTS